MVAAKHKSIIYKSLDEISIWNLYKVLDGKKQYLIVGYEHGDYKLTKEIEEASDYLIEEWNKLNVNQESILHYALILEINYLTKRLETVPVLINGLIKRQGTELYQEYSKELSSWGFNLNQKQPLAKEIEKFKRQLRASESKLRIKEAEYENETKGKAKGLSLIQQKVKLETQLKVTINLRTTVATEWLAYWDELRLMAENIKKWRTK